MLTITGPSTKTYGDVAFSPVASGGSGGGAVTFTSSTPLVCTASGSATVTIVAAGTCSVTATKAADVDYNATTSVAFPISIGKDDQETLVLTGTITPAAYYDTQTLGTTGGSGGGAVSYTSTTLGPCTVSGNTLTIIASSGTCSVHATKAADVNYGAATSATVPITLNKATLTVTPDAQAMTYGQPAPTYTFSVTGFRNGETALTAAAYVAPSCTSAYTSSTPISSSPLPISCSGGSATNYTFDTSATAVLTIGALTQETLVL